MGRVRSYFRLDGAHPSQESGGIRRRIVRKLEHPSTRRCLAQWLWLCQFSQYDLRNPPQIVRGARPIESEHSGVDVSALDRQISGSHYKTMKIQPLEYALENDLGVCEHAVIKYVSRWREKGGVDDLRKAIHYCEILIEREAT